MLSKGWQLFTIFRKKQLDDEAKSKGAPFPVGFWPRVFGEWNTLPDHIKALWEAQAVAPKKELGTSDMQQSLVQSSPRDPSLPVLKRKPSMESKGRAAGAQHVSSPSSSTTSSPSTPGLYPSSVSSPRAAPPTPQSVSTDTPASSQPRSFNPGNSWSGGQYGTSAEVTSLMGHHPSHSAGGRQTATMQVARPHPYISLGTSVSTPHLHVGQPQPVQTAPLRRTQTVMFTPAARTTPLVAGVPTPGADVVRRYNSVPSVVASSNSSYAAQVMTPSIRKHTPPVVLSGQQLRHPVSPECRPPVHTVERPPAVLATAEQPAPSTLYAGVAPYTAPVPQGQAFTPIVEEGTRVYTSAATYYDEVTPVEEVVQLPPNSDPSTPAQAPANPIISVATPFLEFGTGPAQPLWSPSVMELLREIPTPVPDVVNIDAFLDAILAPQFLTAPCPEFEWPTEGNQPLPDALRIWPPGPLPEDITDWLDGGYTTGWEDFDGFPGA